MDSDNMESEKKKSSEQSTKKTETEPLVVKPGGKAKGTVRMENAKKKEEEDK